MNIDQEMHAKFGKLNGWGAWRQDWGSPNPLSVLSRVKDRYRPYARLQHNHHNIFDHCTVYYKHRKCAVLISQPYPPGNDPVQRQKRDIDAVTFGESCGVQVFTPPLINAGWWYPGWADFFVFIHAADLDGPIKWLPEQVDVELLEQLKGRWKIEQEARHAKRKERAR